MLPCFPSSVTPVLLAPEGLPLWGMRRGDIIASIRISEFQLWQKRGTCHSYNVMCKTEETLVSFVPVLGMVFLVQLAQLT